MEAIILAGGFGTRLQHIVSAVPKPMAPIKDRPFLEYILDDLQKKGVNHVVLAVCHMKNIIMNHFGNQYKNIAIEYSMEAEPLLTGGAIKKAASMCKQDVAFVINGDTFFDVDLQAMLTQHKENGNDLTIAVKEMYDFDRYGSVLIQNNRIMGFKEKRYCKDGYINGGIYCMNINLLDSINQKAFSFENDFMTNNWNAIKIEAFVSIGYFIDIGIPKDYCKFQERIQKKNEL